MSDDMSDEKDNDKYTDKEKNLLKSTYVFLLKSKEFNDIQHGILSIQQDPNHRKLSSYQQLTATLFVR